MGLLYPLPISIEEKDFVDVDQQRKEITLKSYGLPYIFWIYGFASLLVFSFMLMGIFSTLKTLLYSTDPINQAIAIMFITFVCALPILVAGFFFYQKVIIANHQEHVFKVLHKVFGLTVKKQTLSFDNEITLHVNHFMDSPNYARIKHGEDMRGFKNKGYFLLEAINGSSKVMVDRSSSKADLEKIKKLLNHSQ